jgi:iron complex outermembrane receptor protein
MTPSAIARVRHGALIGTSTLCLSLALSAAASAQTASPTVAAPAEPAAASRDADIVVTGSRIARRDYDSDTPLTTISSSTLQATSDVGIDQALAKLPQVVPGANQFFSATDLQPTPTNSPGIATVNLRGLGSNRTLVLLDGRRTQPANATLVVDLNTIPAAMIDTVEVITGGAGATYGADAVAGVVNFKLKRNFSGVTIDTQYGQTFRNDGSQFQATALMGGNFADDRGNAVIGISYADRGKVYGKDRAFQRNAFSDPGTAGVASFPVAAGATITPTQAAINSVFVPRGYSPGDVAPADVFYFNPAATTAGANLYSVAAGRVSGRTAPGYQGPTYPGYKYLTNGNLVSNITEGYISLPLTRYSLFGNAHYDVNDNIEFYVQGNFNNTETFTQLGDAPSAFSQWSVTVPYDAAHPVPTELATLLNSRAAPGAAWTLNRALTFLGQRGTHTRTYTYEVLAGFRGKTGLGDFTYDVFGSHGRTSQTAILSGYADLSRYQALINLPNYGANADFNNGRTGLLAHCTSGLNPFVTAPVSQDCIDIISARVKTVTDVTQDQVEANLQGGLVDLPAGSLRLAIGASYRKNGFSYLPDDGISTGNINSVTIGLFDTTGTKGSVDSKEFYGELLVPVIRDKPFFEEVSLNAGYRYSDYNTTGGVSTWKITGDWKMTRWLKLRGGYQAANRAPNVAELFQPAVFQTVPWPDHDPCSNLTRAAYGNVAANPNRAKVQALCTTLAGGFAIGDSYVGNQPQYFPLGRDLQQGNRNLTNEKAKTWTIGGVLRSPFDTPLTRRLSLTVDYYDIRVEGAIAPASTQLVYQECFNGLGNNPNYDPNNSYCKAIIRSNVNGFWIATNAQFQNLGVIHTSGIDAQLDWSIPAPAFGGEEGTINANVVFNYLNAYKVQNNPGGPVFDYAGSVGASPLTPPYGSQYRWKLFSTFSYDFGPASLSMSWRHLPATRNYQKVTTPTSGVQKTGAYDLFTLNGRVKINKIFELRGGIENLFDRSPEVVGRNPGVTNAAGVTDVSNYDILGRRFYFGGSMKF